jgi:hypothetical protein
MKTMKVQITIEQNYHIIELLNLKHKKMPNTTNIFLFFEVGNPWELIGQWRKNQLLIIKVP